MKTVEITLDIDEESPIGAWTMVPKACPAAAHLAALRQKPWSCVAGLQTRGQGAVPISHCEHFGGNETISNTDGPLVAGCNFEQENEQ